MTPSRHVLVIGAGLAGLAASWRLQRADCRVTLLEADSGVGGRLAGERVEGFCFEPAPLLLFHGDTHLREWIGELGLRDELLPAKPVITSFADARGLRDVELRGLSDLARIPGLRRLHAARLVRLPRLLARYGKTLELGAAAEAEQYDDRSLADFAKLYFGESVLRHWMAPFACAGSSGDPAGRSRVQFLQHFAAHGLVRPGVLRGALSEIFERASESADLVTGCSVDRLECGAGGSVRAVASDGRSFVGDACVVATPAPIAAQIADPLLTTPERKFLAGVSYAPQLSVSAALCRSLVPRTRHVLAPAVEGAALAQALVEPGLRGGRVPASGGMASLRATASFAADHEGTPDEALAKELVGDLDRLWPGVAGSVEFTRVYRHRFGAPRFDVGAYRNLARFRRVQDDRLATGRPVVFAGDYLVAPSPEGALRSAEAAVASLLG